MRLSSLFLLCLVLPSLASVDLAFADQSSDLYEADALTLKLTLTNQLQITTYGTNPSVDRVVADLTWFPRASYRQRVVEITTTPDSSVLNDAYRFEWRRPADSPALRLDALVRTTSSPLPVRTKTAFPIMSVSPGLSIYTEPGALIDTNGPIERQALALAQDKDDLFEVVYSVADWVTTNIEYNLSSVGADATQPSTWVMANRKGVCKEMTALFISMLRSLGVPARFVSGVAYTNLPGVADPWGGHAWAEVYFPDVGWVPFDPTYGTYGYVDATHLKLQDSVDAQQQSIDFTMLSRDASLVTRNLGIDVQVTDTESGAPPLFTVTLVPFDDVALDSYDLLTATVKNEEPYYVSARLTLARTQGLEILGSVDRNVLLRPYETKRLTYLVRTDDLSSGFTYTFPLKMYEGMREVAQASFVARNGNPRYDRDFFDSYLELVGSNAPIDDVTLACTPSATKAYVNETIEVRCVATSVARTSGALQGCIASACSRLLLTPGTSDSFSSTLRCESPGTKSVLATAAVPALVRYACLDHARVEIRNLTSPSTLAYGERGTIDFVVASASETLPENLSISVVHDNFVERWSLDRLVAPQRFTLDLAGGSLDLSGNDIELRIEYSDALGERSSTTQTFTIAPRDFSLWDKTRVALQNAQRWIENALA